MVKRLCGREKFSLTIRREDWLCEGTSQPKAAPGQLEDPAAEPSEFLRSGLHAVEQRDQPEAEFQERSHQAMLGATFGCYFAFMCLGFPPRSMSAHHARVISRRQSW